MLTKQLYILLLIFNSSISFCCLNAYRTKLDGSIYEGYDHSGKVHFKNLDTNLIRFEANTLWSDYQTSNSFKDLSDYATKLVYLKEYDKAKAIFQEIEKSNPNLYTTASNLGTLYELTGQPDSAIIWIKKSIQLNPESHKGSEWIHLKILEYQISPFKDSTKSILGLDFGLNSIPINNTNKDLQELYKHIYHQLSERLQFVSPPNKIVGNIYFDLGNTAAITKNLEMAIDYYQEAMNFGFSSELLLKRYLKFKLMISNQENYTDINDFAKKHMVLTLILLLIIVLIILSTPVFIIQQYRKFRKKKRNRS